jgi:hypothetical protein
MAPAEGWDALLHPSDGGRRSWRAVVQVRRSKLAVKAERPTGRMALTATHYSAGRETRCGLCLAMRTYHKGTAGRVMGMDGWAMFLSYSVVECALIPLRRDM